MAAIMNEIIIKSELRPCLVRTMNGEKKTLFHRFVEEPDLFNNKRIKCLVEYEDGTIRISDYQNIKFVDSKLTEYVFEQTEDSIQKYKRVIDKANNWLIEYIKEWNPKDDVVNDLKLLQDILKEVEKESE